jgi:ATP-binding cassette, subfamily C, bacterial CydCD
MTVDRGDRSALFLFALLGAIKALALVAIAEGIARGLTGSTEWVVPLVGGVVLRAVLAWAGHVAGARAAIGTKQRLRRAVVDHALRGGGSRSLAVTATVGLDELDNWYRTVLPAIATTATVPLLIGARILVADWVSALIIVLTVPLVPLFMALVGMHTKEKADAATAAIERLASHVAELARGLPVLVGLGRVEQQSDALARLSDAQRVATVKTLRTAFMSSLVLELIATISVAVVAVFVGIRLLHGEMTLEIGLIALILAPECFAPFRELGSAFHASQAGLAAKRRVADVLAVEPVEDSRTPGAELRVEGLTVRTVHGLSFAPSPGSVTAIVGASGTGKSTVLGVLAGTVTPEIGRVWGVDADHVAYVPQHPHTVGATVRDELSLYGTLVEPQLHRFALDGDADPANLSPGELRRVAVARALVRVDEGATLLLLDEPTAHLDAVSAGIVERAIRELRGTVTIIVASHEQAIVDLADEVVSLGETSFRASSTAPTVDLVHASAVPTSAVPTPPVPAPTSTGGFAEFVAFVRPTAWKTLGASLLGAAAALSGMALLATSGWLIVQASEVDAIMYLLVAIVGVRFFGLGRAALRYAERLTTHDAALGSVADLRRRLWATLAQTGLASRALASSDAALDLLVATPERVLQLVPRIITPIVVGLVASIAVIVTTGLLVPSALGIMVTSIVIAVVVAPVVALVADRAGTRAELAARSVVLRGISRLVRAADDVRANGVSTRARDAVLSADDTATAGARTAALATGIGSAIVMLACGFAAAAVLGNGGAERSILAVIVLLPLALVDPLLAALEAAQLIPALAAQLAKLHVAAPAGGARCTEGEPAIALDDVAVSWPGTAAVFTGVSATVKRGQWLVVEGPSGSGKSTLVAALLGYLPAASGTMTVAGSGVAWAPQESHIFDSTVRGNLLLAGAATDTELRAAMITVGLDLGLDARVGSEGGHLSGGQRQRLAVARALLTTADVVVLDEPTAHLDAEAAADLMRDLRFGLADKVVVLVTHHADEVHAGDVRVRLGQPLTGGRQIDSASDGIVDEDGAVESSVAKLSSGVPLLR